MNRILIATVAAALAAPAALAQETGASAGEARMEEGQIVVDNVMAEAPGYLVVTEQRPEDAMAGEPVAIAVVPRGQSDDVRLEGDFAEGVTYYIVLYEESGMAEGFQWQEGVEDYPVSEEGEHVMTTFDMMMEAGEPEDGGATGG